MNRCLGSSGSSALPDAVQHPPYGLDQATDQNAKKQRYYDRDSSPVRLILGQALRIVVVLLASSNDVLFQFSDGFVSAVHSIGIREGALCDLYRVNRTLGCRNAGLIVLRHAFVTGDNVRGDGAVCPDSSTQSHEYADGDVAPLPNAFPFHVQSMFLNDVMVVGVLDESPDTPN